MSQIKVLIVEDEWIVSEEIKEILEKNNFQVIGQAEDADAAMEIAQQESPDIALLDINIKGGKDGIELAYLLKGCCNPAIIFLTAFEDEHHISRAKELNPQAYIIKPFRERNIVIAIELAFHNMASQAGEAEAAHNDYYLLEDRVFIKEHNRFFKLELINIKYVQAEGSYSEIYTTLGKHTLAINLKHLEDRIKHPDLQRTHRSYLVNLRHVDALEGNMLYIGEKSIPISQSHRDDIMKRLRLI